MDVQQIKNFLVLCETLNFRKAAEQINIVQPALSRQIQLLENEMGAMLFNRNKRAVTLTEAGIFFQKEAQRILPDLKTIAQETSNFQQIEMLLTRKTDIGVAPNIVLPPEVSSKILYSENFVLILPGSHPLSKKKLNDLSVLKNETFILPQLSTGVGYVEAILEICQAFGFKPKVAHESAHSIGVLRLVEAGLGISIEPLSSVRGANMNIKLVELKNLPQKVTMTLFWLHHREEELSRFIEMF